MATSGDYRNVVIIEGQTFSHTIDPRDGFPVNHNLASASIIADDCLTADALATAMMVVGPEAANALAREADVDALWMTRDGESFVTDQTDGFPLLSAEPVEEAEGNGIFAMAGAALIVFAVALIGMSVGVIFSNRTIKGSCGGLAAMKQGDMSSPCEICDARSHCEEFREAQQGAESCGTVACSEESCEPADCAVDGSTSGGKPDNT